MNSWKKLTIAVAAMAVTGSLAGPASAVTRDQLAAMRAFIEARDIRGLNAYISANPELLTDPQLGSAISEIIANPPRSTIFTRLGLANPIPREVRQQVERAVPDPY